MRFIKWQVVSVKMINTIVVKVNTKKTHEKYEKKVTSSKKYYVDADSSKFNIWDLVTIVETRPISKLKCWRIATQEENIKKNNS